MFSMVKMDLYRMVRMKSMYVIMFILAIMTVVSTWALHEEAAMYDDGTQATEQSMEMDTDTEEVIIGIEVGLDSEDMTDITLLDTASAHMSGMVIALLCSIFVVLFCSADFTSGYIKNYAGQTRSRTQLIASKAIVLGIYSVGIFLWYLLVQVLANEIFIGYVHMGDAKAFFSYVAIQLVLHIALSLLWLMVVLLTKSRVIGMMVAVCVCGGIFSLIYAGIDFIVRKLGINNFSFTNYTISGRISMLQETVSRQDGLETLLIGVVYVVLTLIIGSVAFSKKDL